jgi:hypothetical protein
LCHGQSVSIELRTAYALIEDGVAEMYVWGEVGELKAFLEQLRKDVLEERA